MELFRALAVLAEPPVAEAARVAEALGLGPMPGAATYTELFVFQLYPYASVYLGAEGMLGGEARDRVAGFWRALGQTPPAEPDHLATMLALHASLLEAAETASVAAEREGWQRARRAFLWEHLLSWLPVYLAKLDEIASPFYRRWGALLAEALRAEVREVGRQERLSLHLRAAPGLSDPCDGETEQFQSALLSPARSGMILARADLSRAARELGIGTRIGERRFILQALFSQDAAGTLGWLAREAEGWRERHRLNKETLGPVAEAWVEKADASARLLRELERETVEAAF